MSDLKTIRFNDEALEAIKNGTKTVTRRRVDLPAFAIECGYSREDMCRTSTNAHDYYLTDGEDTWQVIPPVFIGDKALVCNSFGVPVAGLSLSVKNVECMLFDTIDDDDAEMEGFETDKQLKDCLIAIYGEGVKEEFLWVIQFEMIKENPAVPKGTTHFAKLWTGTFFYKVEGEVMSIFNEHYKTWRLMAAGSYRPMLKLIEEFKG